MPEPEVHGETAPAFHSIRRLLGKILARGGGGALAVQLGGERVVDLWGGVRDEAGTPWTPDTLCVSYSTTKGVVATAFHRLVDRGLIDYDDRVVDYWPEFGQAGKEAITVRDLMSHRAGLWNARELLEDASHLVDWDRVTSALAAARPSPPPAGATAYQALTWGHAVGELMRRVTGDDVQALVQRELAAPLGTRDLHVGATPDALSRVARLVGSPARREGDPPPKVVRARKRQQRLFRTAEKVMRRLGHPIDLDRTGAAIAPPGISSLDWSSDEVLQACIPSANGVFTARALATLYGALAEGGAPLISPDTLARATEIQSHGWDQITIFKMKWRLGYHRVSTLRGVLPRGFGHFGWGGSGAWADPDRRLSFAFVVNTGAGTPIGDLRITRLSTAVVRAADRMR